MKLLLAADIADRVAEAEASREVINLYDQAESLVSAHPEAHVSYEDVLEVLIEETVGLRTQTYAIL